MDRNKIIVFYAVTYREQADLGNVENEHFLSKKEVKKLYIQLKSLGNSCTINLVLHPDANTNIGNLLVPE